MIALISDSTQDLLGAEPVDGVPTLLDFHYGMPPLYVTVMIL